MGKQVVILGAGLAGIPLAHKLMKNTISKVKDAKLILVSASTHLYWNLAAVRAVIPDQFPETTLFTPIQEGFAKYPASQFELVFGTATGLDPDTSTVLVDVDGTSRSISYDQLVVATGSKLKTDLPLKHVGSTEATKAALKELQQGIKAAKSIVVAGDGLTGIETVAELADAYGGKKDVTLVVSGSVALPTMMPSVGKAAEKALAKMKTKIIHNATVTSAAAEIDKEGKSKTEVKLSNGESLAADVYLPLFGLKPNTSFVPGKLLDAQGQLKLDANLRAVGLTNVWAAGDAGDTEGNMALKAEAQVAHLAKNLDAVLRGNENGVTAYKKSERPLAFVTLGKTKGTGQMGSMKAPGFVVSRVKGKTFFTERGPKAVEGIGA